jgi:hypothetical protein
MTYYSTLELNETAPAGDTRHAFRRLLLKWHPDVNPGDPREAHDRTRLIIEAYEVLKDPASRAAYDTYLRQERSRAATSQAASAGQTMSSGNAAYAGASSTSASFATQSAHGQRAAQQAAAAAHWGMDEVLETLWKGSSDYRRTDAGFGSTVRVGFFGWLVVAAIALTFTGVGAISWVVIWRGVYITLFPNGHFVGFGTLFGGMMFWVATLVGLVVLLSLSGPH